MLQHHLQQHRRSMHCDCSPVPLSPVHAKRSAACAVQQLRTGLQTGLPRRECKPNRLDPHLQRQIKQRPGAKRAAALAPRASATAPPASGTAYPAAARSLPSPQPPCASHHLLPTVCTSHTHGRCRACMAVRGGACGGSLCACLCGHSSHSRGWRARGCRHRRAAGRNGHRSRHARRCAGTLRSAERW